MTLAEFKAWFEGFTESMDGVPDEKQWARIKQRVAMLGAGIQPSQIYPQIGGASFRPIQAGLQDIYANPRNTAAAVDRFPLDNKTAMIG